MFTTKRSEKIRQRSVGFYERQLDYLKTLGQTIKLDELIRDYVDTVIRQSGHLQFLRKLPRVTKSQIAHLKMDFSHLKGNCVSNSGEVTKVVKPQTKDNSFNEKFALAVKLAEEMNLPFAWQNALDDFNNGKDLNWEEYSKLENFGLIRMDGHDAQPEQIGAMNENIELQFGDTKFCYPMILNKTSEAWQKILEERKEHLSKLDNQRHQAHLKNLEKSRAKKKILDEIAENIYNSGESVRKYTPEEVELIKAGGKIPW